MLLISVCDVLFVPLLLKSIVCVQNVLSVIIVSC